MKQRSDVILNLEFRPGGVCGVIRTQVTDKAQGSVFEWNCSLWKERAIYVESISGYRKYTRWILSMSLGFEWSYFSGPFQLSDLWAPFPYLLKDHLFHSTNYKNRHSSWSGCLCSEPGCKAERPGHSTGRNEEREHDKGHTEHFSRTGMAWNITQTCSI